MNATRFEYGSSDIDQRYDQGRTLTASAADAMIDALRCHAPAKVRRVLDLGGGTGRFSQLLAEAFGAPVVVVEPAQNMLAKASAKLHGSSIHLVRGLATAIPAAAGAFDLVFISQVLHHISDLDAAMSEIRRVLDIDCRLFVRQSTRENLGSYFYQQFFPEARAIDERRLPTRERIVTAAAASGLKLATPPQAIKAEVSETSREYVRKISTRTNSDLALISDEAFAGGLAALDRYSKAHPDHPRTEEIDHIVFLAS